MDCSPPVSSVHGISQARILEWVAISFSNTYRNTYNIYTITLWSCRSQIQRVKSKGRNRVKRPLQLSKWEVLNAWISGAARSKRWGSGCGCYLRRKLTWPWWLLSLCASWALWCQFTIWNMFILSAHVETSGQSCTLVTQSCPTLCDPMDYSPLGSSAMELSRQEYWNGSWSF